MDKKRQKLGHSSQNKNGKKVGEKKFIQGDYI